MPADLAARADASGVTRRKQSGLVVLLAINSGFTDAVGFLALGGAFSSVMTGNMVLFGVGLGRADGTMISHSAAAIVSFIVGAALGARVAGTARSDDPVWPWPVTRALLVQAGLVAVFAVGWWGAGTHPSGDWRFVDLAICAMSLGMQSSAIQRFGISGLSTTYLTGTLTQLVIRVASTRRLRDVGLSGALLAGLVGGACVGALIVTSARWLVPAVPLVLVGVACFLSLTAPSTLRPCAVPKPCAYPDLPVLRWALVLIRLVYQLMVRVFDWLVHLVLQPGRAPMCDRICSWFRSL